MPVRPITEAEEHLAAGRPVSNFLILFGASQGFLTHLRFNGLTFNQRNLMPTPFAKASLPCLVLGGAAAGAFVGFQFYGDAQLRRLRISHE